MFPVYLHVLHLCLVCVCLSEREEKNDLSKKGMQEAPRLICRTCRINVYMEHGSIGKKNIESLSFVFIFSCHAITTCRKCVKDTRKIEKKEKNKGKSKRHIFPLRNRL